MADLLIATGPTTTSIALTVSRESAFIDRLRALAADPAARALMDDAAVLTPPGGALVLTHDMLVEGVHFLRDDPAGDVAWKLLAVNLSDLAAKGATPLGVLIGYGMGGAAEWDAGFAEGLGRALAHFGNVPLLGGDTVSMPPGGPRTLGLTAIGAAPSCGAPDRRGARAGDLLFVTGTLGDAGLGLALLQGRERASEEGFEILTSAYRRPTPPIAPGPDLAPLISASADVSDGLLIDAGRIAKASGIALHVDLGRMPLSPAYVDARGDTAESRIAAATSGDDYQILFTAPPERDGEIETVAARHRMRISRIGRCEPGEGRVMLERDGVPLPLPVRLGYEHER